MRTFYRDTTSADTERAIAVMRWSEVARPHDDMEDAIALELREWLSENTKGEIEWDVWEAEKVLAQTGIRPQPDERARFSRYFVVFQFADDKEAAIFRLRWPVLDTLPKGWARPEPVAE